MQRLEISNESITRKTTEFYLSSRDFNGIPLADLYKYARLPELKFKEKINLLIRNRSLDLIYEGSIPNPHIKPFQAPSVDEQIKKLESIEIDQALNSSENAEVFGEGDIRIRFTFDTIGCCVYPTPEHLRKFVDWRHYATRPFTLRLAKGEGQLRPYFFELGILAIYRNDPRYRYSTDDITGSLYSTEDEILNPSDRIFLKHFYFGFDHRGTRSVAVLLGDLDRLSPEHQQIWKAKMLPNSYKFGLHPDARKSILGYFSGKTSIFTSFLEELRVIDQMSRSIKGVSLLKETFSEESKPENFGFLILPTLREYDLFCHTLDRMMCENINETFFDGEIDPTDPETGELLKGKSIKKINLWVTKKFRLPDPKPKDEMIKTFRDIRSLRSKPAHGHYVNKWDLNFYEQQRVLVKKAYAAVRVLRLILANHPKSKMVEVPQWLYEGEIRTF